MCKQVQTSKREVLYKQVNKLSLLNPLEIMKRGFSIAYSPSDKIIKSIEHVHPEDIISLRVMDGLIDL